MKKIILGLSVMMAVVTLASCGNKSLEFNNKLVGIQQKMQPQIDAFGKKMMGSGDGDLKALMPDANSLIAAVDKTIKEINTLEAPKGAEEFKNSMIAQFEFIKTICNQTIKLGDPATTTEEKATIGEEMIKSAEEAEKLENKTLSAQRAFAKANGFKLESK